MQIVSTTGASTALQLFMTRKSDVGEANVIDGASKRGLEVGVERAEKGTAEWWEGSDNY